MSELVLFYLGDEGRSGAYEGDISFEYIEELREFINAKISDEVTDPLFIGTVRQDLAAMIRGSLSILNILPSDILFCFMSSALRSSASIYILRNL